MKCHWPTFACFPPTISNVEMAPYDSDSSDGDTEDYTTTATLLGYASTDPTDDSISQLGGRPVCNRPVDLSYKLTSPVGMD